VLRQDEQVNEFAREMKKCLLDAAEETGNRMAAISNARLPKHRTRSSPRNPDRAA
jgi:hypothetical protein